MRQIEGVGPHVRIVPVWMPRCSTSGSQIKMTKLENARNQCAATAIALEACADSYSFKWTAATGSGNLTRTVAAAT